MSHSIFHRIFGAGGSVRVLLAADGAITSQRKAAIHCVKKGVDYYNTRRYTEAEDLFRQAIAQDPGYARAHCYLGNALHKQGYPEEAMIEWKKTVIVEPNSDSAIKAQGKLDKVAAHNSAIVRSLEERLGVREQQF
jgi:tetratricopeptide (TPR) repeat protein